MSAFSGEGGAAAAAAAAAIEAVPVVEAAATAPAAEAAAATMDAKAGGVKVGDKLAPFNPTNLEAVRLALSMLQLAQGDVLFDLGCGDGRLLIEGCTQFDSVRGVGVEYDSLLCERARGLVQEAGLVARIDIQHDSVINTDLSTATAIFVYLVPAGMAALRPALEACLDRGVRVVSYVFSVPGLTPSRVELYKGSTKMYLYTSSS